MRLAVALKQSSKIFVCGTALLAGIVTAYADGKPNFMWMLPGHSSVVNAVAYSPDGTILASASNDSTVKIWRTSDGAMLRTLSGYTSSAQTIAFSPNGQSLAVGGSYGVVVYRTSDWNVEKNFLDQQGWSMTDVVAFSPDGQYLASGGDEYVGQTTKGVVKVRRVSDGALLRSFVAHDDWIEGLVFTADSQTLITAGYDEFDSSFNFWGYLRYWRVSDGTLIRASAKTKGGFDSVSLSSDGQLLAVSAGHPTREVRLYNPANGSLVRTISGFTQSAYALAFIPGTQNLAVSCNENQIKIYNASNGSVLNTLVPNNSDVIYGLAISPNGQNLAIGGDWYNRSVTTWNIADGSLQHALTKNHQNIYDIAFSPKGNIFAVSYDNNIVKLYNSTDHSVVNELAAKGGILRFSPNGELLLTSDMKLWRVSDGQLMHDLNINLLSGGSSTFSPDSKKLATAGINGNNYDTIAKVFDVETGQIVSTLALDQFSNLTSLTFTPDGTRLAGTNSNQILFFNPVTGAQTGTLNIAASEIAYTPDGQYVATSSWNTGVQLWNTSSMTLARTIPATQNNFQFTQNGQVMISGGSGMLSFWRVSDGALLKQYTEETAGIGAFAASPNGRQLVYGRQDASLFQAQDLFPTQASDTDSDGCVNDFDLANVIFAFGSSVTTPHVGFTDFNSDGITDDFDLAEVIFNFGQGCGN